MLGRLGLLAVLVYIAVDLANPLRPGTIQFEDDVLATLDGDHARSGDTVALMVSAPSAWQEPALPGPSVRPPTWRPSRPHDVARRPRTSLATPGDAAPSPDDD